MMRRIHLLSTVLGTVLLASPALAQRDAVSEMNREHGSSAVPSVPLQNRNAGMADQMAGSEATRWLKEAQDALRRNRPGQAAEMLERAETRLLSRSMMGSGEQPVQGPVVNHTAAARHAIMRRDRATAMREIDMAMNATRGMQGGGMSQGGAAGSWDSGAMGTGSSMGNPPMQGGGGSSFGHSGMGQSGMQGQPGYAPGSATMRDHGMGGSSMSRADLIILAQGGGAGGGGGGGSGAGGDEGKVEGSYPGSPAAGTGSIPRAPGAAGGSTAGMGSSAVPGVPAEGRGPPAPGSATPAPAGSGVTGAPTTGTSR